MLHDLLHALAPLMWTGVAITFLVLRHRRRMAEIAYGQPPAPAASQRELEELRERIRVLERIATDGRASRDLAAEIEALRAR